MRGLLLVLSLNGSSAARPDDGWLSADKAKHFLTSAFVQSLAYGSLRGVGASHGAALVGATITTAAVGVGRKCTTRAPEVIPVCATWRGTRPGRAW